MASDLPDQYVEHVAAHVVDEWDGGGDEQRPQAGVAAA